MIPIRLLSSSLLTLVLGTAVASAAGDAWYVGAGGGVSRLTPDTDGSAFTLEEDTSAAFGAFAGRPFGGRYAVELGATRLGEAGLSDGESIGYTALSGGVLAHLLGDAASVRRGEGAAGFLRLGLSVIDNASDVSLEKEDNLAPWLALGVDVPFGRRWALRAELASFDGDAQAATAALLWRAPLAGRSGGGVLAGEPRPAPSPEPPPEPPLEPPSELPSEPPRAEPPAATAPAATPPAAVPPAAVVDGGDATPRPLPRPLPDIASVPRAATTPSVLDCPPPSSGEPRDARGCALFSGVVDGVDFVPGTATLTAGGERRLDALAASLLDWPAVTVEIRAHVAAGTGAAAAAELSRARAIATARHLAGRGVPLERLRARAFGSERPRADGRGPDARIELGIVAP